MISRDANGVMVYGDISGETPADVLFEQPHIHCADKHSVFDVVERLAGLLSGQGGIIQVALKDPNRRIE
jgi:hypothetical protein